MFFRFALAIALYLLIQAPTASAYLGLIRQGAESAEVPNAQDHYGDRVATGDFNGDGFEDVAVAAPDENNDIGVGGQHGVVIVSYGSEAGITHIGADVLSVGAPTDFQVWFGKGLAAGDFNGDGTTDLAVGIPGLDTIGDDNVGSVWIYEGLPGVGISLAPYVQLYQDDCGASNEDGDQFGYTLTAGDMTLDGFDDLFVGSIGEDNDAGLVGFFPGSAAGVSTTGSGFAKQSHLGGQDEPGSLFGYSLTLGNFLDDDYLELAVGAPKADDGSLLDMGKVYVIRGTANGPIVAGVEIHTPLTLNIPMQLDRLFGWSLAAGSFLDENGARPDLAIGEPHYYSEGVTTSGRVVVVDYDGPGDVVGVSPRILDQGVLGEQINPGAAFGWALAAGNIMDNAGLAGPDGLEDLAIGAPGDDVLVPDASEAIYFDNVGSAYIVPGSHSNFAVAQTKVIDAMERNDLWFGFDEQLGWSLAFGKFDESGWDNLVIGVPNKMYPAFIDPDTDIIEAGQVYVMAPWRQPGNKPHRSSIVKDCADRILYAQRMGQRLTPASTTKAMTALLAAEAIDAGTVDPNQLYTVPAWCANKVTGSQYGLFAGEQMRFHDLVRVMIAVSGNDAAYTVGNILQGETAVWDDTESTEWNLPVVLSDFADMMNTRAQQMGMSPAHTFNNPAGRPYGDHWTTAQDMAIFVGEAMENETFRDIVGTPSWPAIFRLINQQQLLPWAMLPPAWIPVWDVVGNGYYQNIVASDPRATGVKGGWNPESAATGLYSAEVLNGYIKCTIFGVPPYGWLRDLGFELMSLVDSACEPAQVTPAFPTLPPYVNGQSMDEPLDDGRGSSTSAQLDPEDTDDLCVEVLWANRATPTACALARVERTSRFDLANGESRHFASSRNGLQKLNLTLRNFGPDPTRLHLELPIIGFAADVVINPNDSYRIPVPAGIPGQDGSDLLIVNNGDGSDFLELEECYGYDISLGTDPNSPLAWKTILTRDGVFHQDEVRMFVLGCNPADGNTVHIQIRNATNTSTGVEDNNPVPVNVSLVSELSNYPNPFNPQTTIQFELGATAQVSLRVYDLAGRLVRTLESGRELTAGTHRLNWNGTNDRGQTVASGVYLVRVDDGARGHSKRVTLLK